jgi:hypothetical protein
MTNRNSNEERVSVDLHIHHETEDAILVSEYEDADIDERSWLPKSQVTFTRAKGKEYFVVDMPVWLAYKKGFI